MLNFNFGSTLENKANNENQLAESEALKRPDPSGEPLPKFWTTGDRPTFAIQMNKKYKKYHGRLSALHKYKDHTKDLLKKKSHKKAHKKAHKKTHKKKKFEELCQEPIESQQEFFLKSFIFALGDDWKEVPRLASVFRKYLNSAGEGSESLNDVQASDFLQKNGLTRTAIQRKNEVKDIDLDDNKRIAFIEYLLLHFKIMILKEYYKRKEMTPPMKLETEKDAVGLVGVGAQILDELFTWPIGLPAELEEALEKLTEETKKRETRLKTLRQKAASGGVKGMAAANEIIQMEKEDKTEMNRLELTLNAAKKKAQKTAGTEVLKEKQMKKANEEKEKRRESRRRLQEKASLWK